MGGAHGTSSGKKDSGSGCGGSGATAAAAAAAAVGSGGFAEFVKAGGGGTADQRSGFSMGAGNAQELLSVLQSLQQDRKSVV